MNAPSSIILTNPHISSRRRLAVLSTGLLLAWSSQAAWVSYVGADLKTSGAWRAPLVTKALDPDGDNIYGSDGYALATSPGGDLVKNPTYATATRLTTYGYYGGDQTSPHYLLMDNPSGGSFNAGLWMSTGTIDLQEQDMAEITITETASFRVGVLVDQCDYVDLSPKHLRLRQTQGGSADTGLIDCYLEANLDGDWYFFDVGEAQPGDKFVLAGTNQRAGGPFQDGNGIGGLTFDSVLVGPGLQLDLYAGLRITGKTGVVYSVEYITDLGQSNNPSAWRCLEYLRLHSTPYVWFDNAAPAAGPRFYRARPMTAPANMVFIPPGAFLMGSPNDEVGRSANEGPQTIVMFSRGFWMGKCEVTQGEYLALMGFNPSSIQGNLNFPVQFVYWGISGDAYGGATNYCAHLTTRDRASGLIASNCVYRLPTEAEWEYACRAGSTTMYYYGNDPSATNLANYAWYTANSGRTLHPVGQKLPNAWGLYDMHGNVREWCLDRIPYPIPAYAGGYVLDPQAAITGRNGVIRGGDFDRTAQLCRSTARLCSDQSSAGYVTGFRVVLAVE